MARFLLRVAEADTARDPSLQFVFLVLITSVRCPTFIVNAVPVRGQDGRPIKLLPKRLLVKPSCSQGYLFCGAPSSMEADVCLISVQSIR